MNNREQYKRMLNFLANAVILFFQGMCFAYIWYEYYSRVIFMPFFRRGYVCLNPLLLYEGYGRL